MDGIWIHLNLKTIEILKDKIHKINTGSMSTAETLGQSVKHSNLTITTVE